MSGTRNAHVPLCFVVSPINGFGAVQEDTQACSSFWRCVTREAWLGCNCKGKCISLIFYNLSIEFETHGRKLDIAGPTGVLKASSRQAVAVITATMELWDFRQLVRSMYVARVPKAWALQEVHGIPIGVFNAWGVLPYEFLLLSAYGSLSNKNGALLTMQNSHSFSCAQSVDKRCERIVHQR